MKKIIIALFNIVLITVSVYGQGKVQIDVKNKSTTHQLGISKFYFVHHIFADAFFMTNLYKQLENDEMAKVLNSIYNGVTDKDTVNITVRQDGSTDAKLIFFTKNHPEKGNSLIMTTNFSNTTRKFVDDAKDSEYLARWYFIRKDKLVYRKDLYSKEEEKKKKKAEVFELIDFYLFDDNFENDSKIKPLIDKVLNSDESKINKLYAKLYLGEYWLKNNDLDKAEKSVADLKEYFEKETEIPRGYSLIVNMATSELEMMKRI